MDGPKHDLRSPIVDVYIEVVEGGLSFLSKLLKIICQKNDMSIKPVINNI